MMSPCFDVWCYRLRRRTMTLAALALTMLSNGAVAQRSVKVGFTHARANDRAFSGVASYRVPGKTNASVNSDVPHGVIGGALGAVAGGAFGYALAVGLCEKSGGCSGGTAALTGAAIGAILGVGVEWLIRGGS